MWILTIAEQTELPGRHDNQHQVRMWISQTTYKQIRKFVKADRVSQRELLDEAIEQYCRQRSRRKKSKAKR